MIKIGICDDKPEILEKYNRILYEIAEEERIVISVRAFHSGEQLLFELDEDTNEFDLLYLDIEMGELNGIETAKKMRNKGCKAILIFLTDNSSYVFKSFDVMPFQYILKSEITKDRFKDIFMKALKEKKHGDEELFACEFQDVKKVIPLNDICYFDVQNRIVTLHCMRDTFSFYAKLDKICEQLHNRWFVRIHRSFIVNLYYVDRITTKTILMVNGDEIPIGSTYLKTVKDLFSEFLLETA